MNTVEFNSGLEIFSERYALVQSKLVALEQQGPMSLDTSKQYRMLLDELFQIGMDRADYCYAWRDQSESVPAN